MPGKGMTEALFIIRRMQEVYIDKEGKLFMCVVDNAKAFDKSSKNGDRIGNKEERFFC